MLDSKIEFVLLSFACILNIYNVCFGVKTHKQYKIIWLFSVGIVLTLLGYFLHHHDYHTHKQINILMILGSVMLMASNIVNNKMCKFCKSCAVENKI